MKKIRFSIFVFVVMALVGMFNIYLTQSENNKILLSLSSVQKLADAEVVIIPAKDNTDNPTGCSTTKVIALQVAVGDGTFKTEYRSESVRGMENTCTRQKGSTCNAYACYAN